MAGSFTVTISDLAPLSVGTARAEITEIQDMIERGLQKMAAGHLTSVTLTDRNGNTVGTMGWTKNKSN